MMTPFEMKCNPVSTPLEARFKFSEGSKSQSVDSIKFRSIIGSLRYLIHTRPDLTYSLGYLSRCMEAPTTEHLATLKRILRYVKDTINLGVDSDHAGDSTDCKSTTRVLFFLGSNLISWTSHK
ncbi:unnamed protein product [Spirodela intermedia]|uniref:Mitochondrial protein n=1 Tax=Spirodela intermedia TaxID=51605 RepID=A0ABN7EDW0_SPIIN|nr:unnamed protein product [Spirodela intermedia]